MFVVASNAGAAGNPAWFTNLQANPSVTVELGPASYAAQALVIIGVLIGAAGIRNPP